jgi:hypothetical protein
MVPAKSRIGATDEQIQVDTLCTLSAPLGLYVECISTVDNSSIVSYTNVHFGHWESSVVAWMVIL